GSATTGAGGGSAASGSGAGASGAGAGASGSDAAATGGAAETQMEAFLDAIDRMDGGAGVTSVSVRPEYGADAPGAALAACATAAEATELADALLTWWEQAERQAALEENLARTDALLSEAQTNLSMGTGDEKTVAALLEKQAALSDAVEICKAEKKKAELRAPVGADVASLDVPSMSVFFDPGEADVSRVALTAVAYAQTTGKDEAKVEEDTKTALVDLGETYNAAQAALKQYEDAAKNAQDAAQAYSTGDGSKTAWSDALSARADAKSAAVSALAAFSRQANALNALTGGWVSKTYGWNEEAFEPLFAAEVLPPVLDVPGEETPASGGGAAASGDGAATGSGTPADGGASDSGTTTNSGASGGGAVASGDGAATSSGDSGSGATTNSGASGGDAVSSGDGAAASSGDSGDGASTSSGSSGSGTSAGSGDSGSGTTTDNGASGNGAVSSGDGATTGSGDSGNGAGADSGATIDPDADQAIYGGDGLTYKGEGDDTGETKDPYAPRIGEDGKIYPFDPEDEALQNGQGQEEADPEESIRQAGEALIAVLETLFGTNQEEE
ncbi:MAG: hypothetical protein IKN96_05870, partial [Oscillibacter sp.]|nr:hypothetical protein [Oscillibacter sp.]